jgi:hypothetical protein
LYIHESAKQAPGNKERVEKLMLQTRGKADGHMIKPQSLRSLQIKILRISQKQSQGMSQGSDVH